MLLECLACVHVLIIMVVKVSKGTVVLTVTSDGALVKGEPGTILCHVYPFEAAVSWKTSAYQSGGVDKDQSTCILSGDCFPPISLDDARYSFAAIVGNGQFNGTMTISNVECSTDSSRYTCTHSNTANEKEVITSTVQVIPTDLTISESDLTITAKTDCMAESSNLEIQWFKLYDDSAEEEYNVTDIQKSDNSSRCPADGCGTTEVTYSYVHTNPPEPTMEVKFKVKVWHSSRPSEFISRITNKKYKFPGTTTTTATTTTITSPTTVMTASSATAAATSRVPATMTSTSTRTTEVISTVTASPTASSAVASTESTVQTPSTTGSVTPVSDRDSDKALVTMIIVVSVIGGVLIVVIFSIVFVMMHWKRCFTIRGRSNKNAQMSDHRKQHRRAEYNANGRFLTTRQDHAMRGYYFYNGTYKNPLFYDSFENSSYVNNYYPNQKNFHDPEYMSSHETYQYNYDGDYNWDLKHSY